MSRARRVALVTGGSRGIGRAVVEALVDRGVDVAFTYQSSADEARALSESLQSSGGVRVVAVKHDLSTGDAYQLVRTVVHELGHFDSLILNAGTWKGGLIDRLDPDAWWSVVQTNVQGNYAVARAATDVLAESSGSVLFVSSAVGISGFVGDTAYATSKAALTGLARSLAREWGPRGVRANVVAPGFVETDMTAAVSDSARARVSERIILGRFGTAEEIARTICFLSEDATYITGTVLAVDGGWSI